MLRSWGAVSPHETGFSTTFLTSITALFVLFTGVTTKRWGPAALISTSPTGRSFQFWNPPVSSTLKRASWVPTLTRISLPHAAPPFSGSVMVGNTLYVSGTTDGGFKEGDTNTAAAKRVLDNIKRSVEAGGLTMDNLVWVQVFCSDLAAYAEFNAVYRTYFKGPLPARAFLGTNALLNGARFEVMGIAAKP